MANDFFGGNHGKYSRTHRARAAGHSRHQVPVLPGQADLEDRRQLDLGLHMPVAAEPGLGHHRHCL